MLSLVHARSIDKPSILKPKAANLLFKFGRRKWGCEKEGKGEESRVELETGMNRIYRKKENERRYLLAYQAGGRP